MGFLNIFKKSTSGKIPRDQGYLSLVLTPNAILASIWKLDGQKVEILGFGQKNFSNVDNLVHETAVAIDKAGEEAGVDVSDVVFGLSTNWLEDGNPSKETLKILKEISKELDLKPQAFITLASSIAHFLKVEEQVTLQAVLLGVFDGQIEASLITGGKAVTTQTAQGEVTPEKIKETVNLLKDEGELPARVIFYPFGQNSKEVDNLTSKELESLFLQEPKIDFLSERDLAKSVAFAQSADILGHDPVLKTASISTSLTYEQKGQSNELGFVEGEDILKKDPIQPEVHKEEKAVETPAQEPKKEYAIEPEINQKVDTKIKITFPPAAVSNLFKSLSPTKIGAIIAGLLIIMIVGLFIAGQTLTKAQVLIKVDAQNIEDDFSVTAIKNGTYDADELTIAAQELSGRASDSQKAVATGSKKTGDAAKGEVKVLNWTTNSKTFAANTVIISKNGLKFSLDNEVTVASRSASLPGETKVNVIAQDIGENSNLDAGSDFTFQEFDEILYSARNDTAITGGNERTATVVSQEDLARLEKSLSDSLTEKAKADLKNKSPGKNINNEAVIVKITSKSFDQKVGEEATLVSLTMEVEAAALVYDEGELKKILSDFIKDDVPADQEAKSENIELIEIKVRRQTNQLVMSGKFRANLIPKINEQDLRSQVAGKSVKDARAQVKKIPQVKDVIITFSPRVSLFSNIPSNKEKIELKIEPE